MTARIFTRYLPVGVPTVKRHVKDKVRIVLPQQVHQSQPVHSLVNFLPTCIEVEGIVSPDSGSWRRLSALLLQIGVSRSLNLVRLSL